MVVMVENAQQCLARNKKAILNCQFHKIYEVGIELKGSEVKSAKQGNINLNGSYCKFRDKELFLVGSNIAPYEFAGKYTNHDPSRERKLLLHSHQLKEIYGWVKEKKAIVVPIRAFIKRGIIKIEIGIGFPKRKYDKREEMKKREAIRETKSYKRTKF